MVDDHDTMSAGLHLIEHFVAMHKQRWLLSHAREIPHGSSVVLEVRSKQNNCCRGTLKGLAGATKMLFVHTH